MVNQVSANFCLELIASWPRPYSIIHVSITIDAGDFMNDGQAAGVFDGAALHEPIFMKAIIYRRNIENQFASSRLLLMTVVFAGWP